MKIPHQSVITLNINFDYVQTFLYVTASSRFKIQMNIGQNQRVFKLFYRPFDAIRLRQITL
ncbi:hypothetical protein [Paenibacillus campi]|uniref:hypothetical protein n=1 Tax=Paenibacillus campi TaxID=3106031 RepID=UPI002AFF98F0|nr:hypothetical protein [Paenibacillus sp. SGZ-1014]